MKIPGLLLLVFLSALPLEKLAHAFLYNVGAFWHKSMSLEVPIELIDTGISSNTSVHTAGVSQTNLDTTYYDGTVTYSFEIVASNTDSSSKTVSLLDSGNTVVASISIPSGTSAQTRFSTSFTPDAAASTYKIQIPATTAQYDINISAARILVDQVSATKTRIYFPLLADDIANNNPVDTSIDSNTGTSWYITDTSGSGVVDAYRWLKDSTYLNNVATGTPWTLDAIIASDSTSATASIGLFKYGTTTQVTGSTASTTATSPTLVSVSFADTATNFTNGSEFEVKVKSSTSSNIAKVYKAGIWVALSPLTGGEVAYRVGRASNNATAGLTYTSGQRAVFNTSAFTNPTVYFEDTSACSVASCGTTRLYSDGTTDSGTAGTTLVTSNSPGTSVARTRSSSVSITSGNRYLGAMNVSTGTLYLTSELGIVIFQ